MLDVAGDHLTFARHAAASFHSIGAVAPSGRELVAAMTAAIDPDGDPVRVLEVGAGTGPMTQGLLRRLPAGSSLVVVEPNTGFTERLRALGAQRPDVTTEVHAVLLQDLDAPGPYHHIVSSLPFAIFSADVVETIVERLLADLTPGGIFSYFAYRGAQLRIALTPPGRERDKQLAVQGYLRRVHAEHHGTTVPAWINLPPAVVRTIRLPG